MGAVFQRVKEASGTVDRRVVGQIGPGLLVFLGVGRDDGAADIDFLAGKIATLRIFPAAEGKMDRSVADIGGSVLLISQFTLFGDCRKGRRPDFTAAGAPQPAKALYEQMIAALQSRGLHVETGVFAAHMDIDSRHDGPVTLLLDSQKAF